MIAYLMANDSGLCVPEKRPPFEGSTTVCRRGLGPARQTANIHTEIFNLYFLKTRNVAFDK